MINKILPIVIVLAAVGGSGFAAMTLKGGGGAPEVDKKAKGGVHEAKEEVEEEEYDYFSFRRSFIVPVIDQKSVEALILMSLSVEAKAEEIPNISKREPRIRDAFMRTLLSMSHDGLFAQDITDPEVYDEVQSRLLATAHEVVDPSVKSVLIVDFAVQDQS